MFGSLPSFTSACSLAQADVPLPDSAGRGIVLFVIVAGGLGLLFLVIILLSISNRRHQAALRRKQDDPDAETDAWKAAGQRIKPDPPKKQE